MLEIASVRRQARIAGLLYLLDAATGVFYLAYLPGRLFTPGGAAATAAHVRESATLLRFSIACELIQQVVEVFLILVLFGLFRSVSKPLARQMAVLGLIPIPIVLLNVLNEIAAQTFANGARIVPGLGAPQRDALAALSITLHAQGLEIAAIFWGLWLIPFGLLILRCGFIPKPFGFAVMIAAAGYLLGSFTSLLMPSAAGAVEGISGLLELGEPPIILWLLIWGARAPASPTPRPSIAT